MVDGGIAVLAALISPFESERQMARALFEKGEFFEVFINTPLELAKERDPKGLYKKARAGELKNFTGVDSPYEPPKNPDLVILTQNIGVDEIVQQIFEKLEIQFF